MGSFYTPQEIADILKLEKTTIYNYIRQGKLKAAKFGRQYRVQQEDLQNFIEENTKK